VRLLLGAGSQGLDCRGLKKRLRERQDEKIRRCFLYILYNLVDRGRGMITCRINYLHIKVATP
jgi:hypothetical protein